MHKSRTFGSNGQPALRIRSRHAPKPQKFVGIEGWVSWALVDREGRETRGGEQHNLILDTFLDRLAVMPLSSAGNFASLLSHFAVGTGSTPPTAADTALSAELARTTTQSTLSLTRAAEGVYEFTLAREFDFGVGNGNLAEFGFSYGPNAQMLVRELFRDGTGTPIVITKTSDYKLVITYNFTIALTPVWSARGSFTIAGIGLVHGDFGFTLGTSSGMADLDIFGQVSTGGSPVVGGDARPAPAIPATYASSVNWSSATTGALATPSAYTPGTYSRSVAATYSTSQLNGTVATLGLAVSSGADVRPGFLFAIDPGDRFTKDSLHILSINDLLTVTWGRA